MSKERLLRVVWRLEEMKSSRGEGVYSNHQLHVAIMEECGSSDRTIRDNIRALRKLGLIYSNGLGTWIIDKSLAKQEKYGYGEGNATLGTIDRVPTSRLPTDSVQDSEESLEFSD